MAYLVEWSIVLRGPWKCVVIADSEAEAERVVREFYELRCSDPVEILEEVEVFNSKDFPTTSLLDHVRL